VNYSANLAAIHGEHPCYFGMSKLVFFRKATDFLYRVPRKLGLSGKFASRMIRSSLSAHVIKVVGIRSCPKVLRVTTRWVVAVMANQQTVRNRTVGQYPTRHMGVNKPFSALPPRDLPVPILAAIGSPKPARTQFWSALWDRTVSIYVSLKSGSKRDGKTLRKGGVLLKYVWHTISSVDCFARPVAAVTARGTSILSTSVNPVN
jgi:hypothetical protein